jgi:hypothetical protein
MPASARLGIAAMALGVFSLPILCIPFVGSASLAVSAVGLLLGGWGLLKARHEGAGRPGGAPAGGAQVWYGFGARAVDFPLAGMAACLLALVLGLWPLLSR